MTMDEALMHHSVSLRSAKDDSLLGIADDLDRMAEALCKWDCKFVYGFQDKELESFGEGQWRLNSTLQIRLDGFDGLCNGEYKHKKIFIPKCPIKDRGIEVNGDNVHVLEGTDVPAVEVARMRGGGYSNEDILEKFPELSMEKLKKAFLEK